MVDVRFSEVVAALSHALDLTEGQVPGHAARTCIIGMRIGREIGLPQREQAALFYALLLKDLGCSSNAARICALFGADDRVTKFGLKTVNWKSTAAQVRYLVRNAGAGLGGGMMARAGRFMAVASGGARVARQLIKTRCDRGANIARGLGLDELSAGAIHSLDEHYNGGGYPDGLIGEEIPILSRIMGLAQTAEVFWQEGGMGEATEVAIERTGTWFDPVLVEVLESLRSDFFLAASLNADDVAAEAARLEPRACVRVADDAALDRLAEAFAQVIDAKSPWTHRHSAGVATIAGGIGERLGLDGERLRTLHRAALLHDIGKLGVSNLILDKAGQLTEDELAAMRLHPHHTRSILARVGAFAGFAEMAAAHHEKLDGRGYHLGLSADDITQETRILTVADMYEALAAKRPYRKDLAPQEIYAIIGREAGTAVCADAVAALRAFVEESGFVPAVACDDGACEVPAERVAA